MENNEYKLPYSILDMHNNAKKTNYVIQLLKEAAVKGEGEYFGEYALITKNPRTATVKCKNYCEFAVLDKKDYNTVIGNAQKK